MAADKEKSSRTKRYSPITKPIFIPAAPKVELFQGMEDGQLETKVIAKGPFGGNLLITNKTDEPITVEMPQAFATVHVLKQFGQGGGGLGGGGFGQGGGGLGGGGLGGGGQQNQGGGLGGGGLGGGGLGGGGLGGGGLGQGGGGQGFFSIPPEKTVKLPYTSVCLEHGKADPTPQASYKIVPLEDYTQDETLRQLITMVASGRLPAQAAQAAVWSRTDNMSWQELAAKAKYDVVRGKVPYFQHNELRAAQMIVTTAQGRAKEVAKTRGDKPAEQPVRGRVR
ncbi:MAG: hypothetical protein NXI04_20920 [Planctomycetaceae bacterium]|nr:hypothetical protein [Planctomycetaceae bacterium]